MALHYKQEGGIESVSVEVVAGTPTTGAASDPELGGGSILNGDAEAYAAIARVPIAGLAPSEPVVLVGGLKSNSQLAESISAIGDSVSQTAARVPGKMFVGSVVSTVDSSSTASGHEARLFTEEEFTEKFGRSFDSSKDYIGVMNGDGMAANAYLDSATYFPATGNIWVGVPGVSNGNTIRLNYLVVLGD